MKLSEIIERLNATEIHSVNDYDPDVTTVCAADFLSDILATKKRNFIILTGYTSQQVIRTADIVGAVAVIFVRGKYPPAETIGMAKAHAIPLYVSQDPMFESCIKLAKVLDVPHERPKRV